ncbi:MAG: hypothetical protein GIW99_02255 [Candidatus Eremiobacteraeota bacterium]|nr:hypothetical protein [Candidatus Eremiobacteraeota bacterium]MBC5826498.1 hypothetical protein [Candidatus Eremiobacteraeota bacterium]
MKLPTLPGKVGDEPPPPQPAKEATAMNAQVQHVMVFLSETATLSSPQ